MGGQSVAMVLRRMGVAGLVAAVALLGACGGQQDAATAGDGNTTSGSSLRSLGLAEVTMSGIGTDKMSSEIRFIGVPDAQDPARARALQARAETLTNVVNGFEFKLLSSNFGDIGVRGAGGTRFMSATYRVRNAQSCSGGGCPAYSTARKNVTFLSVSTSTTLLQSSILRLTKLDGTAANPQIALQLKHSHGADGFATGVDPARASLQVYRESELPPTDPDATSVMPVGFVVHNVNDGSRNLPASPAVGQFDGLITFAFKVPLQTVAGEDPARVTFLFQFAEDSETRVTQSAEEASYAADLASSQRAATVGAENLTVLCGRVAQVLSGNPICDVRIAGPAGAATAYLVNNGTGSPRVAAAPSNRTHLPGRQAVVLGTSAAMNAPTVQSFVVQGSQSGLRTLSGAYAGTLEGGGSGGKSNQLIWRIGAGDRPFFPGETVSFTATSANLSSAGAALTPFVGSFVVAGSAPTATGDFSVASSQALPAYTRAVASGDFNGDGFPDLVLVSESPGTLMVYLGDGTGSFRTLAYSQAVGAGRDVAVGDVDGDGKLDLVVTSAAYPWATVLLGNGSGGFTAGAGMVNSTAVTVGGGHLAVRLADMDEDGILDIVSIRAGSPIISVFKGNGGGGFAAPVNAATLSVGTALLVGDIDADGHQDVIVGLGNASQVQVFKGTGLGTFSPFTSTYATGLVPNELELVDVTGDQIADLLVGAGSLRGGLAVLPGQGGGVLGAAIVTSNTGAGGGLQVGDLDGDNLPDVVMGDGVVWKGLGNGSFTYQGAMSTRAGSSVLLQDLDGDGQRDLVVLEVRNGGASESRLRVFLGNGLGGFEGRGYRAGARPVAVALGDLNGDGILDAVVANADDNSVSVLLGTGNGQFGAAVNYPVGSSPEALVIGDLNGDGRLDVAVVNSGSSTVSVLLGNGSGGLGTASSVAVGASPFGIAIGDLNGDGNLDLVAANSDGNSVSVLLGNGTGGFSSVGSVSVSGGPQAVALADFNLDGRLDLVVATAGNDRVSVLLGNGSGGFGSPTAYVVGSVPLAMAVGDLNGDGVPDVVVANYGGASATVLFGRSDGTLGGAMTLATGDEPVSVALADVQGDGRLDILVANFATDSLSVFRNSGLNASAVLGFTAIQYGLGSEPTGIALGDLDADGKLEVVSVGVGGRVRVASDF